MRPTKSFFWWPAKTEKFNLLSYPITADIDTAPEELQLERIDMQSDHTVKEMFNAVCDISWLLQIFVYRKISIYEEICWENVLYIWIYIYL
jgi:hypothetical protein